MLNCICMPYSATFLFANICICAHTYDWSECMYVSTMNKQRHRQNLPGCSAVSAATLLTANWMPWSGNSVYLALRQITIRADTPHHI